MSIVSETLKKLEKKRELDKGPVSKASQPAVNEKKIPPLLLVLLLLAVFVIGVWYFLDQNTLSKQLGMDYHKAAAGRATTQSAVEPVEEDVIIKTEFPVETGAESDITEEEETADEIIEQPPDLQLGGIVTGPGESYAIVNGHTVKKGDEIEGATIIDVDDYGITFLFNGEKYKIKI